MQRLQPYLKLQHLAKILLRSSIDPSGHTSEEQHWESRLLELYEERHTLSIPNLFLLGFSADVASYGRGPVQCRALSFMISLPRTCQPPQSSLHSKSIKMFDKKTTWRSLG